MPELEWSDSLHSASRDHLVDIGNKGLLSHYGSDKSTYKERIERYCQWGGSIYEAIDYGVHETAKDVVIGWLVDDGNEKRTNRNNILGGDYRHCAIATGSHKET